MKKLVSFVLSLVLIISTIMIVPFSATAQVNLDDNKAYVLMDGKYYEAEKGDIFTYNYYLKVDNLKISSLDVRVNYNGDGLKFLPDVDEYGDYDFVTMFPITKTAVVNFDMPNQLRFNYSSVVGVRFPYENSILFSGKFEVTADTGLYEIDSYMMTLGDTDLNKIVFKGEKLGDYTDSAKTEDLVQIVETPTDSPTEAPTDIPTDVPTEAPTDIPTDVPTEVVTQEPTDVSTEVPTDAPTEERTDAPTDIPTELPTDEPTLEPTEGPKPTPLEGKIYLINSADWETVCAYAWVDMHLNAMWPGVVMTKTDKVWENGAEIYVLEFVLDYDNIIFSNCGENQTADLILPDEYIIDGYYYDNADDCWYQEYIAPSEIPTDVPTEVPTDVPTEEPTDTPTDIPTELPTVEPTQEPTEEPKPAPIEGKVYLINSAKWETVYAYTWFGSYINTMWPGVAMTKTDKVWENGAEIYVLEFALDYDNIIFSNCGENQTADLVLPDKYIVDGYYYDNADDCWYAEYIAPSEIPTDVPTEVPTDVPTEEPTDTPTDIPTELPTYVPTQEPTDAPTDIATEVPTEMPTVPPIPDGTMNVYLINEAQWDEVYVYAWGEDNTSAAWPGIKMNLIGITYEGYEVYHINFAPLGNFKNIIFNNNGDIYTNELQIKKNGFYNNADMEWETKYEYTPLDPPSDPDIDKPLLGDVTGDGKINVIDATMLQKHIANMVVLSEEELARGDVNSDGNSNVLDATLIQKKIANIITDFTPA